MSKYPRKLLLLLSFSCFSFLAYSSSTDTVSAKLQRKLLEVSTDSAKAIALKNICWYYRYSSLDSCVMYGKKAINQAILCGNKKLQADVSRFIGVSYWHYAYEEESVEWIYASLKIAEEINDKSGIAYCYDNIGKSFYSQGLYDKALDYFKKAKTNFSQLKDEQGMGYALLHCSWVFLDRNELDSALNAAELSLQLRRKTADVYLINGAMGAVADVYRAMGKYGKALAICRTIQYSSDTTYAHFGFADYYQQIAEIYRLAGNKDSAIFYATQSLDISLHYKNYRQVIKTARTLQQIYTADKNYERALYYQDLYYENKERLSKDRTGLLLARKDAEHEYNIKTEHFKSRSFMLIIGLFALLLIALAIALVSFVKNKRIQGYNLLLEQKHAEIEEQKKILETQKAELSKLNDMKNKMFSVVSHDIRSPLISLQSMFYLYNNQLITPEEIIGLMPSVEKHVNNTANFVNNLLYWAKSQFGGLKISKTVFNLHDCINEEVVLLERKAEEKNIHFKWDRSQPLQVKADRNMIGIAIRNLLNNAVKFTKQNGNISILTSKKIDEAVVCIKDEGSGMTKKQLQNLFISSNSTVGTANESGSGLGLILSKDFIESNNGKICVESKLGEGSSFYVMLKKDDN